ncbi:MAG: glutathione peroxidase [Endozoicomonas sp. (ex Botrylloides leachii)]|nr:glutathione peroxidase [Endozoicomonas sp. (ex Botrylloides leachii)]
MNFNDYKMPLLNGELKSLGDYQNNIVLVVNTASKCGFTRQYKALEDLYQKYKDEGFIVLGFPCNQFGNQEPGDSTEIGQFCERNYGVTFPIFKKIDVNGSNAAPLFHDLQQEATGLFGSKRIKWNFTKFLVNPMTKSVCRYAPHKKPEDLDLDIRLSLNRAKRRQRAVTTAV